MSDNEYNIDHIDDMPESSEKTELIRAAIRYYDQINDYDNAYDARMLMMEDVNLSGVYSNLQDGMMALSWCVKAYDEKMVKEKSLSWLMIQHRNTISNAMDIINFSKTDIEKLLNDYKERCKNNNFGVLSSYILELEYLSTIKDQNPRDDLYSLINKTAQDKLSECNVCNQFAVIEHKCTTSRYRDAVPMAKKMLKRFNECPNGGRKIVNLMLLHAIINDDQENPELFRTTSYKKIGDDNFYCHAMGYHMYFFAKNDQEKGLDLFKKRVSWSLVPGAKPFRYMIFCLGAAVLFKKVSETQEFIKMKVSTKLDFYNKSGDYNANEIFKYYKGEYFEFAKRYDLRNGNDYYEKLYQTVIKDVD